MTNTLRVALVDDHAVVREGYRRLLELESDMTVVAEYVDADSTYAALTATRGPRVDLLVLDLSLPGGSGIDLLRRLSSRCPGLRVLVFTMHDNPAMVTQCLNAGAAGFVTKSSEPALLIDAVRRAARGELPLSPDVARVLLADSKGAPHAQLSPRAFAILLGLIEGRNLDDIADELRLSPKTIANYQTMIRHRLGVDNGVELLRYAQRYGLGSA